MAALVLFPKYRAAFCQEAPAQAPREMRMVFHSRLPQTVSHRKRGKFIFAIPAGMEIRLLTMGMKRQRKTV